MEPITAQALTNITPNEISLWSLIIKADFVVKSVMFILFLASVVSWGIIIERYLMISTIYSKLQKFESKFWKGGSLENFYYHVKNENDHPAAKLFIKVLNERDRLIQDNLPIDFIRERISCVVRIFFNKELMSLEGRIPVLATIGSVAPFIGLFGTVWGIMNSFTAIANSNNTSLSIVAPGIAEALFATALGLFAAIPAVMAYNKLGNMVSGYMKNLEIFAEELENVIFKHLVQSQSK